MDNFGLAVLFVVAAFLSPVVFLAFVFLIVVGGPALMGRIGRSVGANRMQTGGAVEPRTLSHDAAGYDNVIGDARFVPHRH